MPKKRPPKKLDPAEVAAILGYGDRHGDRAAAAKFNVSYRTIKRYRAAIRDGKAPELDRLVQQQKARAVNKCIDLLTETYELALKRLQEVLPEATPHHVIGAVKIVGELALTRDALKGDDEQQSSGNQQGAAPAADAAQASQAPAIH